VSRAHWFGSWGGLTSGREALRGGSGGRGASYGACGSQTLCQVTQSRLLRADVLVGSRFVCKFQAEVVEV